MEWTRSVVNAISGAWHSVTGRTSRDNRRVQHDLAIQPMIVLDAGHGGEDSGATYPRENVEEKQIALEIQKVLEHFLIHDGLIYKTARDSDYYVGLGERARSANDVRADIFISIHANFFPDSNASGFEVFHFPGSDQGQKLAKAIKENWLLNMDCRGVKTNENFVVLKETDMPAVLVETGFLSNEGDRRLLTSHSGIYQAALSIFEGITDHLDSATD